MLNKLEIEPNGNSINVISKFIVPVRDDNCDYPHRTQKKNLIMAAVNNNNNNNNNTFWFILSTSVYNCFCENRNLCLLLHKWTLPTGHRMIQLVIFHCHLYVSQQQEMIPHVGSNWAKCKNPSYKHMTHDVMKAHSLGRWRRNQRAITREWGRRGGHVLRNMCVQYHYAVINYNRYSGVLFCFLT